VPQQHLALRALPHGGEASRPTKGMPINSEKNRYPPFGPTLSIDDMPVCLISSSCAPRLYLTQHPPAPPSYSAILNASEPKQARSGSGRHRQQEEGKGDDHDVHDVTSVDETGDGGAAALGGSPRLVRVRAAAAERSSPSLEQHH
jgi:hypothetical protein